MNRQHFELKDRPMDWQDKLVLKACWFTGCAVFVISAYWP